MRVALPWEPRSSAFLAASARKSRAEARVLFRLNFAGGGLVLVRWWEAQGEGRGSERLSGDWQSVSEFRNSKVKDAMWGASKTASSGGPSLADIAQVYERNQDATL